MKAVKPDAPEMIIIVVILAIYHKKILPYGPYSSKSGHYSYNEIPQKQQIPEIKTSMLSFPVYFIVPVRSIKSCR